MRHVVSRLAVPLALLLCLLAPVGQAAAAKSDPVPPDNAGVDQYTENVPGVDGDQPSGNLGGSDQGGANGVSPSDLEALSDLGSQGADAAALIERTAGSSPSGRKGSSADAGSASGLGDSSGFSAVLSAVIGGDGGMGIWLPLLLGAILAFGALAAFKRARAGSDGAE